LSLHPLSLLVVHHDGCHVVDATEVLPRPFEGEERGVTWVVVLETAAGPFAEEEGGVSDGVEAFEGGADVSFGDDAGLLGQGGEDFRWAAVARLA